MTGILTAERGYIYKWENPNTTKDNFNPNYCLVISCPRRRRDKMISVLFLTTDRGDVAEDIVRFKFNHEEYVVRCDLVTYTQRPYLKEQMVQFPEYLMEQVNEKLAESMGITSDKNYKQMYYDLLDKVLVNS